MGLNSFETDMHHVAKRYRIEGTIYMIAAGTGLIATNGFSSMGWDTYTAGMMALGIFGIGRIMTGERLIRALKKHTGVDVPKF